MHPVFEPTKSMFAVLALSTALSESAGATGLSEASVRMPEASAASVAATASVAVAGTLSVFAATGEAVVASVRTVGDGTLIVLTGVADASTATIRVVGAGAQAAGLGAGGIVQVSVAGTGYVVRSAGRVVCFVPDRIGNGLLHSHRLGGDR